VAFAFSVFSRIPVVQESSSLLGLSPEWNQTPKHQSLSWRLLDDHFESTFFDHGDKLEIRCRGKHFLPATMPVAADSLVCVANALHCVRQPQDRRGHPQIFEPHKLILTGTATIPRRATKIFQALSVKVNGGAEMGAVDVADSRIKLLSLAQDSIELCVGELQPSHVRTGCPAIAVRLGLVGY